jgi:hypothetical protein
MTAMADKDRWEAWRRGQRGRNRALLVVLVILAALFYFIAMVRFGAHL